MPSFFRNDLRNAEEAKRDRLRERNKLICQVIFELAVVSKEVWWLLPLQFLNTIGTRLNLVELRRRYRNAKGYDLPPKNRAQ